MRCIDSSHEETILRMSSWFSILPSLFQSIYLSISISPGVLFIVASRRYVPVRGSHATSNPWPHMLRSSLATSDPHVGVNMRFVYLPTLYRRCTSYMYFVILKIEFYDARKKWERGQIWFKLIPLSLEGISCAPKHRNLSLSLLEIKYLQDDYNIYESIPDTTQVPWAF